MSARGNAIRQQGLEADLEEHRKLVADQQQQQLQRIKARHDKSIKKVTTELEKMKTLADKQKETISKMQNEKKSEMEGLLLQQFKASVKEATPKKPISAESSTKRRVSKLTL